MIKRVANLLNYEKSLSPRVHFDRDSEDRRTLTLHVGAVLTGLLNLYLGVQNRSQLYKSIVFITFTHSFYQYVRASFTCAVIDPGYITQEVLDMQPKEIVAAWPSPPGSPSSNVRKIDNKICPYCSKTKPKRAHHCGTCDVCIERYDHHCPYLDNCIGFRNFPYFFKVNVYGVSSGLISLISCFDQIISSDYYKPTFIKSNIWKTLLFIFTISLQTAGTAFNIKILFRTIYLTWRGQTLVEKKSGVRFYKTVRENYQLFLGKNWGWWLVMGGKR
ncbi:Palmitoyltransferase [Hexamita inflata]|uniref:Palmitoyltransferase n=1 Tax=Hexamita inflata TaxID=28002 RepID=A0AA86TY08_9EUKA|nr:Palmitoyltransferase [Hexamita inflata]